MKNDETKRQLARYASVKFDEGDEWLEAISSELVGKLAVGETVAVHMQDGTYRVGELTGFFYSSPYDDRSTATVVSSITPSNGTGMRAADVVSAVGEFLAADEDLRKLAASACGGAGSQDGANPAARVMLAAVADSGGEWGDFAKLLIAKVDRTLERDEIATSRLRATASLS